MLTRYTALIASLAGLFGCGPISYEDAPAGKFTGELVVLWLDDGDDDFGSGRFVYVPRPDAPLRFERAARSDYPIIQPEVMYTDGGTIPRFGQAFKGFNPWGYAPAYMVHDWLFVAQRCIADPNGTPSEGELRMEGMEFLESARIMAEAIKTLTRQGMVARQDVAERVIPSVVAGPFSRRLWRDGQTCASQRLSPEHETRVLAAFPGEDILINGRRKSISLRGARDVRPGRIVNALSFD